MYRLFALIPDRTAGPDSRSRPPLARLGGVALAAALIVAACGDDSGGDDSNSDEEEDASSSVEVAVEGCESGAISGGDDPGEAPDMPEEPDAALDAAITKTKELSSAVTSLEINVEAPQGSSLVDMETAFDDKGMMRAVAKQGVDGDEATVVFCSDGETGWLHLDYADVHEALPSDVSWVDGPSEEMFEAGLIRDPKTTWDVFAILRGLEGAEDAGTEHVGDVEVRRIRGRIDYEAALAASSEEEAQAIATMVTASSEADITAEAGLDGDGVLRWLELDVAGEQPSLDGEAEEGDGALEADFAIAVRDANPSVGAPNRPDADRTVRLSEVPEVERLLRGG